VKADLPDFCYVGGRAEFLQPEAPKTVQSLGRKLGDSSFLNVASSFHQTIAYVEYQKDGKQGLEREWACYDTEIQRGHVLHYGQRCEMQTFKDDLNLDPCREAVNGKFEQFLGVVKVSYSTLKCVELEVPEYMNNCVLGIERHAAPGQGWLAFRSNWPKLASIFGIIRKDQSGQGQVKRINFPLGTDVVYHGDLILLPFQPEHVTDDNHHGLDVASVKLMLDPAYFCKLCSQNKAQSAPANRQRQDFLPLPPTLHRGLSMFPSLKARLVVKYGPGVQLRREISNEVIHMSLQLSSRAGMHSIMSSQSTTEPHTFHFKTARA